MNGSLLARAGAEAAGTGFLLAAVVGSGIMAERLAGGNVALALLGNTLATAAALYALITCLAPVSGAHLNPAVTLVMAARRALPWPDVPLYLVAQLAGAIGGVWAAHAMFAEPILMFGTKARAGGAHLFSEAVATFALVGAILLCLRFRPGAIAATVAAVIAAGYWFTASTSFANPAVTVARALSDTFAGIRPHDAPGFIVAQLLGAAAAALACAPLLRPAAAASYRATSSSTAAGSVSGSEQTGPRQI